MGNYNLNLDDDIHQALRERDEPIVDALNEAARLYLDIASMDNEAGLRRRIDDLEQRIAEWDAREAHAAEKKAELETQRDILLQQLEELQEEKNTLEEDLDELLDKMQDAGMNVFAEHTRVDEIARTHDMTAESVLDELQARADERDLDMGPARFREKKANAVIGQGGEA